MSQTKGSSEERAAREAAGQEKSDELTLRAEKTSGVGQTESDGQASDRDADGRRLWEQAEQEKNESEEQGADETDAKAEAAPPSDETGDQLDLLA